ncbi:alternate-type signal peptide domain-containing protein [Georgenia sp. SYP-B2076]|uniref:alternate-type signal peptide domain-containing protein n=1 Tax=Georgenia sp. SYP-B2076 TaxID=2495881 RepID=UPI000F8D6073|nr:alternate-type signal peptide domain-containing protein [Georgenia sp. SYP-B2076]
MSRSTGHAATKSSSKAVKAIAAGAVGIALLAAGGSSFASWNATQAVRSESAISSGTLKLKDATAGVWTNSVGATVEPSTYKVVPGDVLTFKQSVTIEAKGDLLNAALTTNIATPAVTGDSDLAAALGQSSTFFVNGKPSERLSATIKQSATDQKLDVVLTVTFPDTVAGATAQAQRVNLSNVEVQLTQGAARNA